MQNKEIDLIAFMGQSNMTGQGTAEDTPNVPEGTAYEFRAVTNPTRLYPLTEPFGKDENDLEGVFEPGMKTGSKKIKMMIKILRITLRCGYMCFCPDQSPYSLNH